MDKVLSAAISNAHKAIARIEADIQADCRILSAATAAITNLRKRADRLSRWTSRLRNLYRRALLQTQLQSRRSPQAWQKWKPAVRRAVVPRRLPAVPRPYRPRKKVGLPKRLPLTKALQTDINDD